MKKIGSIQFFEDVDLNLKFDFNELIEYFKGSKQGVKEKLLDENQNLDMSKLQQWIELYVNKKIKEKFGDEYLLDVMDDAIDISWDIDVKSIKKHHKESVTCYGKFINLSLLCHTAKSHLRHFKDT